MKLDSARCAVQFLLFVLTCPGTSQAFDAACPVEEDALEQPTLFQTSNERHDLRQTQFLALNEKADIGEEELERFLANLSMSNIESAVNQTSPELKLIGDQDSGQMSDVDITIQYYQRMCPHVWYLLRRHIWYWRIWIQTKEGLTIDYCFTYWWVWATWCPTGGCGIYYYPMKSNWDPRYKCYPDHRVIWLPMACYRWTIIDGQGVGQWIPWIWRKVYIPRGCCCRRFFYWLSFNENTCPITS